MTKNTSGGSGHKRRSNSSATAKPVKDINELARTEAGGEVYGKIVRALGNRRFEVSCQMRDGSKKEINCSIRGSFKKLVVKDDYVLVQLFDFNDRQAIILTSYTADDVFKLKRAKLWDYTESGANHDDEDFSPLSQPKAKPKPPSQPKPVSRNNVQVQKFFTDDESETEKAEEETLDQPFVPVVSKPVRNTPLTSLTSYDIDSI